MPALTIKESSDDDADVIDVLKQRLLLQATSKLSRGEVEDRLPLPRTLAAQEEHRSMRDKALTYITTTKSDELTHLIEDRPADPCVYWAVLSERFDPTTDHSKHENWNTIMNATLSKYGGNLSKLSSALEKAQTKLRNLGDIVSDSSLINALIRAVPDDDNIKLQITKASIMKKRDMKFQDAVSAISADLSSKNSSAASSSVDRRRCDGSQNCR